MTNEKIAELLGKLCYDAHEKETDYAVQLFVERVVLPKSIISYNAEVMQEFILKYLNEYGIK